MKIYKFKKTTQTNPPLNAKPKKIKYDFDKRSKSKNEMRELLDEGMMFNNRAAIRKHFNVEELEFLWEETKRRKLHKWTAWIITVLYEKQRNY